MRRDRIRVGIVGFGEIGRIHARHLQNAGTEIVGIVTRHPKSNHKFPAYPSLSALIPHVDAITIAVPNHLHASLCLEAIKAGKAVLVEKPLCLTTCELLQLKTELFSAKMPVKVGFRLRWNPCMSALRKRLVHPQHISCVYKLGIERLAADKDWTRHQSRSGGALFTLGVHALDLVRWLSGARGEPLKNLRAYSYHEDESADFPLVATVSGVLANGARLLAGADLRGDAAFVLDLQIEGERGYPDPTLPSPYPEETNASDAEYEGLIGDFVKTISEGKTNLDEFDEYIECHHELVKAQEIIATR